MDKFKGVQVGDTVFVPSFVPERQGAYGSAGKIFYLALPVERVTKTQFVVGDRRIRISDGALIGSQGRESLYGVRKEGEECRGKIVMDETLPMMAYRASAMRAQYVHSTIDHEIELGHPNLKPIYDKLKEVEALLVDSQ